MEEKGLKSNALNQHAETERHKKAVRDVTRLRLPVQSVIFCVEQIFVRKRIPAVEIK